MNHLLGRVFEESGLITVTIAMVREHAERVKPPRALFVPFPFGLALGKPNDPEQQPQVIPPPWVCCTSHLPVLADFPEAEAPALLRQASAVKPLTAAAELDAADEGTMLRMFYERGLEEHQGRTAVGLSLSEELHTWFWGETAVDQLLPTVGQRLHDSDDPAWKALAYGLSR
jgi:hypothetical protein